MKSTDETHTNEPLSPLMRAVPVVLITGISGAGKSSALKYLEDLGYEAIDNVPISLIPRLIVQSEEMQPLAIGADIRTRNFNSEALLSEVKTLQDRRDIVARVLFIDCSDGVLINRFDETRRRHPLAVDRPISDGLRQERELLEPLRKYADTTVDTSEMEMRELKRILRARFQLSDRPELLVRLTSFGFKNGLPRDADLVFDVRFLRNPHYQPNLRELTGRDKAVARYIEDDEGFEVFFSNLTTLLEPLVPQLTEDGKSYLTIAIGCTGGRHRSVLTVERLRDWFTKNGYFPLLRHRDLAMTKQ